MDLDSKGLSRLRRVANPRDVWVSESGDFTPWLAENLDVLAGELGMTLTVRATEVPVGEFRLDILAEDDEGRAVVIENQLERTDHSHLGQCLVYASGLEASTVIWVSPLFRDDFRRALDWLNERTDLGVNFFGVEVSVVQIGEAGPRAPVFEVVARPNDWQKAVKGGGGTALADSVSPLNAKRQDFFAEVLSEVVGAQPEIKMPARGRHNWISLASGPFGSWALTVTIDSRLRVEAYIDCGDKNRNKALFDELFLNRAQLEQEIGFELNWERLDDKRASRIAAYKEFDVDDEVRRDELRQWASSSLLAMYNSMNRSMRDRARRLKQGATEISSDQPSHSSAALVVSDGTNDVHLD